MLHAAGHSDAARATGARHLRLHGCPDHEPLTRFALLLEDDDEAEARLGASGQIGRRQRSVRRARRSIRPTRRGWRSREAMVGNFDWCLRMFRGDIYRCDERHPLWNVLAFERRRQASIPLPYDFDLSGAGGRTPHLVRTGVQRRLRAAAVERERRSAGTGAANAVAVRTFRCSTTRAPHFLAVRSKVNDAIERSSADSGQGPRPAVRRRLL